MVRTICPINPCCGYDAEELIRELRGGGGWVVELDGRGAG